MQIDDLKAHFAGILAGIGEDPDREGLIETPQRAAKAMAYLCRGYNQDLNTVVNDAIFSSGNDDMIIVKDIELYSLCEHHVLPFIGRAHVAYLPRGKVIGLSKIARIVDMYARRLQIQENLTVQIADAISEAIGTPQLIICPPLSIGYSKWFLPFPGTISLEQDTLVRLLLDYCRSLARHGFKNVVLVSSHDGDYGPMEDAAAIERFLDQQVIAVMSGASVSSTMASAGRACARAWILREPSYVSVPPNPSLKPSLR